MRIFIPVWANSAESNLNRWRTEPYPRFHFFEKDNERKLFGSTEPGEGFLIYTIIENIKRCIGYFEATSVIKKCPDHPQYEYYFEIDPNSVVYFDEKKQFKLDDLINHLRTKHTITKSFNNRQGKYKLDKSEAETARDWLKRNRYLT